VKEADADVAEPAIAARHRPRGHRPGHGGGRGRARGGPAPPV